MIKRALDTYDSSIICGFAKAKILELLLEIISDAAYAHILRLLTNIDRTTYYVQTT